MPRSMSGSRDLIGRRKDGAKVPIEIGLNPITTSAGAFVLASIVDLTVQKRTERQINRLSRDLKRQTRQLEVAERDLTDFVSIVSRDLQPPLRGIGSLANWLVTDSSNKLNGSGREQLNLLATKVRRLNTLIDRILISSRTDRGREERATVPLKSLARNRVKVLAAPQIQIDVDATLATSRMEPAKARQLVQAC